MNVTQRSLIAIFFLMLCTFGFYAIYWVVVTKQEINKLGGQIPTAWLFIIPIAHIYFLYCFAQEFTRIILRNESQTIGYFLLLFLLPFIGLLVCQSKMNKVSRLELFE